MDLTIAVVVYAVGEVAVRRAYGPEPWFLYTQHLTGGHEFVLNSHGLREREFPVARPPAEMRVLCVGNSSTWGAGVGLEDTYPKQLERMLNQGDEHGPNFVINAAGQGRLGFGGQGLAGLSAQAILRYVCTEGLLFSPSVVVYGFSPHIIGHTVLAAAADTVSERATVAPWSDVEPAGGWPARVIAHSKKVYAQLSALSWFFPYLDVAISTSLYRCGVVRDEIGRDRGATPAYAFDVPGVDYGRIDEAYGALARTLASLNVAVRQGGGTLIVLNIPSRFEVSDLPRDNIQNTDVSKARIDPTERLRAICAAQGLPFVDMRVRFRAARQEMIEGARPWDNLYTYDYTHLSPEGHRLVAEQLMEVLRTQDRLASMRRAAAGLWP